MYNTSDALGRARYGARYASAASLTATHNLRRYCYHNNLVFLTSHPAFSLALEQSLQAVDPRVAQPYWDFMIDHGLGASWSRSVVYDEAWFGSVNNTAGDGFRVRGRFRNVSVVYDPGAAKYPDSDHSPYGFVSNPESTNPSRALQRTNNFCGMENAQGFPSCARLRDCFSNFTSLYDFDLCVENNVHANLHGLHGGLWDCPVDLEAELAAMPWASRALLSFVFANVAEEVLTKSSTLFDHYECPDACVVGEDTFATCRCTTTLNQSTLAALDDHATFEYIGPAIAKLASGYEGARFMASDPYKGFIPSRWHSTWLYFKGLSFEQTNTLYRLYFRVLAQPGLYGQFATGAAPNDPIFWPMHPIFDKITQALRLSNPLNGFNLTWHNPPVSGCDAGMGWNDTLPFRELFAPNFTAANGTGFYTNQELWDYFDPAGDAIPYVYDQFETWGDCNWDPVYGENGDVAYQ